MGKSCSTPEIAQSDYIQPKNDIQQDIGILEEKEVDEEIDTKDTRILIACDKGCLYEYSLLQNKTTRTFDKIYFNSNRMFINLGRPSEEHNNIHTIVMADNRRNFFTNNFFGDLYEFHKNSDKWIKRFQETSCYQLVLTYDGRYLITVNKKEGQLVSKLEVRSTRTWKLLYVLELKGGRNGQVKSLTCSQDNKLLFIIFNKKLSVVDIKRGFVIDLNYPIYSISLFQNNLTAIIHCADASFHTLSWIKDPRHSTDFQVNKSYDERLGKWNIKKIWLVDNDEKLLIYQKDELLIQDLFSSKITKPFDCFQAKDMDLIDNKKKIVFVNLWNNLVVVNFKLLKKVSMSETNLENKKVKVLKVIC